MNRRIKKWFAVCDSPFPKVKLVNNAVQVKNMKNEQIPCLLQGNGFLFLPRAYDTSFKLIASSKQWIKLPKSTCRYERNRIMKINLKKKCLQLFFNCTSKRNVPALKISIQKFWFQMWSDKRLDLDLDKNCRRNNIFLLSEKKIRSLTSWLINIYKLLIILFFYEIEIPMIV